MGSFSIWFFAAQAVVGIVSGALAAAGIISPETFKIIGAVVGTTLPIPATALGVAHLKTTAETEAAILAIDAMPPIPGRGLVEDQTRGTVRDIAANIRVRQRHG